jgi:hypothetical protein
LSLALVVTFLTVLTPVVHAQGQPADPPMVFTYRDTDGQGTLSLQDLGPDEATGGRQVKVLLQQQGVSFLGSGITLQLESGSPFTTLITFSLASPWGVSYYFQGKIISGITVSGQGTYHRTGYPESKDSWNIVLGGPQPQSSGIRGVAMAGPIYPVEQPGVPNTRPLPNALITVQPPNGGPEIARQRTDANGRFQIGLPAGTYRLVPLPPEPGAVLPYANPRMVSVPAGQYVELVINYDTGIR